LVLRQEGKTRDISTKGLYFVIERDLEAGSALDLTLTLPGRLPTDRMSLCERRGKLCAWNDDWKMVSKKWGSPL